MSGGSPSLRLLSSTHVPLKFTFAAEATRLKAKTRAATLPSKIVRFIRTPYVLSSLKLRSCLRGVTLFLALGRSRPFPQQRLDRNFKCGPITLSDHLLPDAALAIDYVGNGKAGAITRLLAYLL